MTTVYKPCERNPDNELLEAINKMTRGISEERLNEVLGVMSISHLSKLLLIAECAELNQWQPINENTPKDRLINIYDEGYGQTIVTWNEFYKCFTDFHGHKYMQPTHWQEIPEDPL